MISPRADLAFLFSPALSDFFPDNEEIADEDEEAVDRSVECLLVEGSGWSMEAGFFKGLSSTKFFLEK